MNLRKLTVSDLVLNIVERYKIACPGCEDPGPEPTKDQRPPGPMIPSIAEEYGNTAYAMALNGWRARKEANARYNMLLGITRIEWPSLTDAIMAINGLFGSTRWTDLECDTCHTLVQKVLEIETNEDGDGYTQSHRVCLSCIVDVMGVT